MPVEREFFISRRMMKERPDTLFVFGDNLERWGKGGQAKEMRDEPNAVGLPTKRKPARTEDAYFTDDDYDEVVAVTRPTVSRLLKHVSEGGTVMWPLNGIGTGRAELSKRAPRIDAFYENLLRALYSVKGIRT